MSDNRKSSAFHNNPQFAQPTIFVIDPRTIPGFVAPVAPSTSRPIPEDFKRYAQCADCGKGKLFKCFKGSKTTCDAARETHTHFRCDCGGGRNVTFAGIVEFRTKETRRMPR